jgi:hypothetical protein
MFSKKLFFKIVPLLVLLLSLYSNILYADTEGKLFLKVEAELGNQQSIRTSLEKIFNRGIQSQNIHEAILKLRDLNNKQINIDITDEIKSKVKEMRTEIVLEIEEEYCFVNCHRDGYPHILVHYGFNSPPKLDLIYPKNNEVFSRRDISFSWEGGDLDGLLLEFRLEISKNPMFKEQNIFQSEWTNESIYDLELEDGFYFWRVVARDNSKFNNTVFSNSKTFEVFTEWVENNDEDEIWQNEKVEEESTQSWVEIGKKQQKDIDTLLEDDDFNNEMPQVEVRGEIEISQLLESKDIPNLSKCKYKYNKTRGTLERLECTLNPPKLILVTNTYRGYDAYENRLIGVYNPRIKISVDVYECIFWPFCFEKYIQTFSQEKEAYTMNLVYIDNIPMLIDEYREGDNNSFQAFMLSYEDLAGKEIYARYFLNTEITFQNSWDGIVLYSPKSNILEIPVSVEFRSLERKNLFQFPFNRYIGVTQWYGYTAYQSPHTGIDFGSYKEPINSIADGYIHNVGWHHGSHSCISGGNFVSIRHDKGMYSVYLHLENYKKENGQNWKTGDRILEGELIGISGNTGLFNCQPLGYHLHFELRENSHPLSHTDPVPHIDIDWEYIPTLGYIQNPGRLTGNNPHPKR